MKRLYASFLVVLVAACAAIGSVQPQDFNDRLVSSYSTVTALRDSATQLLAAQKISSADHKQITDQLETARFGLDAARATFLADPVGSNTRLSAIRTGVAALQSYLLTKEAK